MISVRGSAIVAFIGLVAVAATPVRADLISSCTSTTNPGDCALFGHTHTGNDSDLVTGAVGNFTNIQINLVGQDDTTAPAILDVHNLEIDVIGAGQVSFFLTEDNLTANGAQKFLMSFGTAQITGDITLTREFYLDYGTANQVLLGSCIANAGCTLTSAAQNISGNYSVTEEIDLNAGATCTDVRGHKCSLSTDDLFSAVPEPAALSIFGLGLLAFGALGWRRRKGNNLAA